MRKALLAAAVALSAGSASADVFGGTFRNSAGHQVLHASVEPGDDSNATYCFPNGTGGANCIPWQGVEGSWDSKTTFRGRIGTWTFTRNGSNYDVLFVANDGNEFTAVFEPETTVEELLSSN